MMAEPLILIADDAAFMRKMIRMTLAEAGLTNVEEAKNGYEAIALYKKEKPVLVLLDITMAGKSGLETLKELRQMDPEARVVMCSAIGQEQTVMAAIQAGALDYVVKPFQKDKLVETVQNLL